MSTTEQEEVRQELAATLAEAHTYSPATMALVDRDFLAGCDVTTLLDTAVEAVTVVANIDLCDAQLYDPMAGALVIQAHRGFSERFLDTFRVVSDATTSCGLAWIRRERVIVPDVFTSPIYTATDGVDALIEAGSRGVVSMPLIGGLGMPVGVCSMHYRQPFRTEVDDVLDLLLRHIGNQAEIATLRNV